MTTITIASREDIEVLAQSNFGDSSGSLSWNATPKTVKKEKVTPTGTPQRAHSSTDALMMSPKRSGNLMDKKMEDTTESNESEISDSE